MSTLQGLSRNVGSSSVDQEISRLLWNPNANYRVRKTTSLFSILRQFHSVYTLISCIFNTGIYLNTILPFATRPQYVGFEVLTAVVMKNIIFWDITPCNHLKVNRLFGGTYRLHLQGRKISRARALLATCFQADFLLDLFLDPEDGGNILPRKVSWLSTDYTASYPRRQ
jgi:hypothetical protein